MDQYEQTSLTELEPLFRQAERENLWFWTVYKDSWFSPADLRSKHKQGAFIWGAINWRLRNPVERLEELREQRVVIDAEIEQFQRRLDS
jgi:hypothetical protein